MCENLLKSPHLNSTFTVCIIINKSSHIVNDVHHSPLTESTSLNKKRETIILCVVCVINTKCVTFNNKEAVAQ